MIFTTLGHVALAVGGRLAGDPTAIVRGVSIDTRTLQPGDLFVALKSARDGHDFLDVARGQGASGALIRDDFEFSGSTSVIRVADPFQALASLATFERSRISATVIAITGSAGKTSTKDFTATVLKSRLNVTASPASFNNEIGVPLTVLSASESTDVVVAEVGARGPGHIRALMPMVLPHISIVTNVGAAHIGMFGSLDAVATAKAELVQALQPGGCAILNADDERVAAMSVPAGADRITFGVSPHADVVASDLRLDADARARFTLGLGGENEEVLLPVSGEHMVPNALAAAAAAYRLDFKAAEIASELGRIRAARHRMQIVESPGGWTVIDDTYNASPASVIAALKTLKSMGRTRRTIAILGPMAELGEASFEQHDSIGRLAVRLGISKLIVVGDDAKALFEAARHEGMSADDALFATDAETAIALIVSIMDREDIVLVKGARVAALERIVEAITQ